MKLQRPVLTGMVLLVTLSIVPAAQAQLPWRWFAPKAADKIVSAQAPQLDPRRAVEVTVEIAWLADPVTFPYYLEAHANGSQVEVRGYVPNKAVREQALRIARVFSSLPVADSMKEHASLLVQPSQMSAQQLQSSVQSSLRVALPKQYTNLKVDCGSDGKVYVYGTVSTMEEKIAVSHSLRRLHGCTSVQNLATLSSDVLAPPINLAAREKTPIIKTSNTIEPKNDRLLAAADATKSKSWFSWPFGKAPVTTREEPPLLDAHPRNALDKNGPVLVDAKVSADPKYDGPILIPNATQTPEPPMETPEVIKVESPVAPAKAPAAADLQKRIQAACPLVKSVEVEMTANQLRVLLEIRNDNDLKPTAERVFALPELVSYQVQLQFKITSP